MFAVGIDSDWITYTRLISFCSLMYCRFFFSYHSILEHIAIFVYENGTSHYTHWRQLWFFDEKVYEKFSCINRRKKFFLVGFYPNGQRIYRNIDKFGYCNVVREFFSCCLRMTKRKKQILSKDILQMFFHYNKKKVREYYL